MAAAALEPVPMPTIEQLAITGDALLALCDREPPESPLPGVLDVAPTLHVLSGAPKTGKTSFLIHIALAWCQGVAPWPGAPQLPGSRALFLSAEQSAYRVADLAARLTRSTGIGSCEAWKDRFLIAAAADNETADSAGLVSCSGALLRELRVGEPGAPGGLDLLREALLTAANADPIGLVVLDSLSRLKPALVNENDAGDMTAWLDELAALAVDLGVYIVLIHHSGLSNRSDPTTKARGSSAIGAVAQVNLGFDRVAGDPSKRRLTAAGNMILAGTTVFRVTDAGDERIDFFRPAEGSLTDEVLAALAEANEPSSVVALATAITSKKEPGGHFRGRLRHVLSHLVEQGQVEATGGKRSKYQLAEAPPSLALGGPSEF